MLAASTWHRLPEAACELGLEVAFSNVKLCGKFSFENYDKLEEQSRKILKTLLKRIKTFWQIKKVL